MRKQKNQQQQQQGFVIIKGEQSPKAAQQQAQFQIVQYVDAWKQRQQQVQTIKRQFQKKSIEHQGIPPIYIDKKTRKICLFHGTTTDQFRSFTEDQKNIFAKFYLTFDLEEALQYAKNRYQKKRSQTDTHQGLLVFKLKDESILQKLHEFEISDTHIVLKTPETIELFLENTNVEMISIKQPSTKQQG